MRYFKEHTLSLDVYYTFISISNRASLLDVEVLGPLFAFEIVHNATRKSFYERDIQYVLDRWLFVHREVPGRHACTKAMEVPYKAPTKATSLFTFLFACHVLWYPLALHITQHQANIGSYCSHPYGTIINLTESLS